MQIFDNNLIKFTLLFALLSVSLVVVFLRLPPNKVYISQNSVEASNYGVTVYNKSGGILFFLSPLNDYFYQANSKEHIQSKLEDSNNGDLYEKLLVSIQDLGLNRRSLIWDTKGSNSKGEVRENFIIKPSLKTIEITRNIAFQNVQTSAIGQTLTICPDCLIIDNNQRAYFNGNLLTKEKIDNAIRFDLTPIVIGESQAFPHNVSKIYTLSFDGKQQMQVNINKDMQVYLQDKWHLLEIKTPVGQSSNVNLIQNIYIAN